MRKWTINKASIGQETIGKSGASSGAPSGTSSGASSGASSGVNTKSGILQIVLQYL